MRRFVIIAVILGSSSFVFGQAKRNTRTVPKPAATPAVTPAALPEPTPPAAGKKNQRANEGNTEAARPTTYKPVYVYTFDRPGFQYSSIKIEHDDDGRGRIWFKQDKADEAFDDPIAISPATMATLKSAFDELHFIDSSESYQVPGRDYSTMGNVSITENRPGKWRTVSYNWTENKAAKILMDTYRAIANEATWKFEMSIARENQPLSAPALADLMDQYVRRNEVPDPPHLVPYLRELADDERLPLIARNHLTRVADAIAKAKK